MSRPLPTDEQVRNAMEEELAQSNTAGRRATITNVEKGLRVSHATFYRNYPDLIAWFKAQLTSRPDTVVSKDDTQRDDELARIRRVNSDLRKQVRIYAEAIRQLTLDKAALEDELQGLTQVTSLTERRRQQHEDQRTTDKIERPT